MSFREKPQGEDRNNYSQNADFKNSCTKKAMLSFKSGFEKPISRKIDHEHSVDKITPDLLQSSNIQ